MRARYWPAPPFSASTRSVNTRQERPDKDNALEAVRAAVMSMTRVTGARPNPARRQPFLAPGTIRGITARASSRHPVIGVAACLARRLRSAPPCRPWAPRPPPQDRAIVRSGPR